MTVINAVDTFRARKAHIDMLKAFVNASTVADCIISLRWLRDTIATAPESDLTNLVFIARTIENEMQRKYGRWTTY